MSCDGSCDYTPIPIPISLYPYIPISLYPCIPISLYPYPCPCPCPYSPIPLSLSLSLSIPILVPKSLALYPYIPSPSPISLSLSIYPYVVYELWQKQRGEQNKPSTRGHTSTKGFCVSLWVRVRVRVRITVRVRVRVRIRVRVRAIRMVVWFRVKDKHKAIPIPRQSSQDETRQRPSSITRQHIRYGSGLGVLSMINKTRPSSRPLTLILSLTLTFDNPNPNSNPHPP